MMIYIIGLFVGLLNGLFASGAGQILVIYLIFFKKFDTHVTRAVSVSVLSAASIFAIFGYSNIVNYDLGKVISLALVSGIFGFLGAKLMKKIPADILNIISGVLVIGLTLYNIFFKGG